MSRERNGKKCKTDFYVWIISVETSLSNVTGKEPEVAAIWNKTG